MNSQQVAACFAMSVGSVALAQAPYPSETSLRFEVWDGSQWTNQVSAHPGDRIEWRAVVSYVGTRTDIHGLAEMTFQPVIPNADNEGPVKDELGPWRNGGVTGNYVPDSMLTPAEGASGAALASYGRVSFGYPATVATASNILTSFRHTNGSNGAPAGNWLRVAGNYVSQWPVAGDAPDFSVADQNRVLRGVYCAQNSNYLPTGTGLNPFYVAGSTSVVVFRQSLIVGDENTDRMVDITAEDWSFRRAGTTSSPTDNRRYISWYTEEVQQFGAAYRTSLTVTGARAIVTVPEPQAFALAVWALPLVARRRRGSPCGARTMVR